MTSILLLYINLLILSIIELQWLIVKLSIDQKQYIITIWSVSKKICVLYYIIVSRRQQVHKKFCRFQQSCDIGNGKMVNGKIDYHQISKKLKKKTAELTFIICQLFKW